MRYMVSGYIDRKIKSIRVGLLALMVAGTPVVLASNYKIESQSLDSALKSFASQAKIQLMYTGTDVADLTAPGVFGDYSYEQVVQKLLVNTDLQYKIVSDGLIVIQPAESSSQKDSGSGSSNMERIDSKIQKNIELEEIVVISRKREERLQDVPDSITAFTRYKIESMGIQDVGDFVAYTPNMSMKDGTSFTSASSSLTMRGITGGARYIIDGVPMSNSNSIFSGTLADVERIEVLRGPQSVLFGAGSISGAVNIVTRKPTNEFEAKVKAGYAKGNDKTISGLISGPVVEDKLHFLLNAYSRDSDGLIKSGSSNGIDLSTIDRQQINGRLLYTPNEDFELDLRLFTLREKNGADYTAKISSFDLRETFNASTDPRRRVAGLDDRNIDRISLRVAWDLSWATLSSITSYEDSETSLRTGGCWDDPNDPAVDEDPVTIGVQAGCIFGIAVGSSAGPGEVIDNDYRQLNKSTSWTQDFRLTSVDSDNLHWVVGADFLRQERVGGFDLGIIVGPVPGDFVNIFPSWGGGDEFWWGLYGQASYNLSDQLELTLAARYDENTHENTTYTSRDLDTIIPGFGPDGSLVDIQEVTRSKFQPKAQLSYKINSETMVYVTLSEGFKAGLWSGLNIFIEPETTTNYEVGVKSVLFDNRLSVTSAIFHIDYADQQIFTFNDVSDNDAGGAFGTIVNIPETNIDGLELEIALHATDALVLSAGVGYLDSRTTDGVRPPFTPEWTINTQIDYTVPLSNDWNLIAHTDYSYEGNQITNSGLQTVVSAVGFMNIRIGIENNRWRSTLFVKNALNKRTIENALNLRPSGAYLRGQNLPRSYGIELSYKF